MFRILRKEENGKIKKNRQRIVAIKISFSSFVLQFINRIYYLSKIWISKIFFLDRFVAAYTAGHGLGYFFFLAGHVASRPDPNTIIFNEN
ncbi:hypothetical protein BpHYR1_044106 [Brachionus plicatilis]|uniref:Uncharacterized protein n=1 Tax=Brachionus plicatilis TaxID=10195 RepID=A0A3M7Q9J1_BRAPC|nr:hypothetical protein BpHYR1_044106 [Brachionus plicatilis]